MSPASLSVHLSAGIQVVSMSQFRSAAQLCPALCDPVGRSTPGLPIHHRSPPRVCTDWAVVDSAAVRTGVQASARISFVPVSQEWDRWTLWQPLFLVF